MDETSARKSYRKSSTFKSKTLGVIAERCLAYGHFVQELKIVNAPIYRIVGFEKCGFYQLKLKHLRKYILPENNTTQQSRVAPTQPPWANLGTTSYHKYQYALCTHKILSSLTFDDDRFDERRRPVGVTQTMTDEFDLSVHHVERQAPVFVCLRHVPRQTGSARDRVAVTADGTLDETGGRLLVPLQGQRCGGGENREVRGHMLVRKVRQRNATARKQDRAEKGKGKTNNIISQSARHIAGLRLIRYGTITYIHWK